MIILTAKGSFADAYLRQYPDSSVEVASFRELGETGFTEKLRQATTVIHNAATINCEDLEQAVVRNFDFTRFVIRQLRAVNPNAHLIFLSSMSVLDSVDDQKYGDILTMSPYAYSKYLAETFCLKSGLQHVSCVRFSTLFYGDPAKDGLSKLVADAVTTKKITLYNHGEARRNFLPLRIAVQYVQKLTEQSTTGQQTYNLAAPEATSFHEVAAMLKELVDGLTVDNTDVPATTPVLASFSNKDIDALGRVAFVLKDEISAYRKGLS